MRLCASPMPRPLGLPGCRLPAGRRLHNLQQRPFYRLFSASKELCFYFECCDERGLCSRPRQDVGWNADIAPRTPAPAFSKLYDSPEVWSCDTCFYLLAPRSCRTMRVRQASRTT